MTLALCQDTQAEAIDWPALLDGALPDLVRAGRLDEARSLLATATSPVPGPPEPGPPEPGPAGPGPYNL